VSRKIAGAASLATVVATLGLATTGVPGAASAAANPDELAAEGQPAVRSDNRPDALSRKQAAQRREAVDALVTGKARLKGKGEDRSIAMANGVNVEYPASQSAQLLTFLIEFGDDASNPTFPDNTEGPLHNEIPEPSRSDNTTYWLPDFSKQHFQDMFFNGLAAQGGESFKNVYKEMSSGRFDLKGDVSDWVQVPNAASYYSDDDGGEPGSLMKEFLQDGADAWYAKQLSLGKTAQQIRDYLATFDVWDRFDYDGDGEYNEPDGYIDHFQAVHAGEDESAGAEPWAIWAHRSSTNVNQQVGPDFNQNGGIQIGTTGFWIRDYTVEPENGGIGVFAHEFGHDLGLPDYYDTQGGDNSTGFWTLMSRGSWMGHGRDTIGTTPNHMGAPDKAFLGWYGANDLKSVNGQQPAQTVNLGPSYHSTSEGAQAVAVTLPQGHATIEVAEPVQGTHYLYSGAGNDRTAFATDPSVNVPAGTPELTAKVSYSTEDDWDYAYLRVSDDGGVHWHYVDTNLSTDTDPQQANRGHGITGCSGTRDPDGVCDMAWADLTADLTDFAGKNVQVQFMMANDTAYYELGFAVDDIRIDGTVLTDVEDGAPAWVLRGFRVMDGSTYVKDFDRYYLAENRQPMGYEKTLVEGPYSFDYATTAPDKVDHFPYQDGLLVWYVNGLYEDNDSIAHPGEGYALPVDSTPAYVRWSNGNAASGDLNARDATFDVDTLDALHLNSETNGGRIFDVPARPSVPVFDDSDVNGYWDPTTLRSSLYSVQVAGIGSMIQVLSSDEKTGHMAVKAGKRFVAVTAPASISGRPTPRRMLTAVAPRFFQSGVAVTYQWLVNGHPVPGATGTTYKVKRSDAGKKITVVATGTKAGYDSATSASAAAGTARTAMSVDAPKHVKQGHKAKIIVTVTASGDTPKGTVKVKYQGETLVAKRLKHGVARLRLPAMWRPGVKTLEVHYVPRAGFSAASSTVELRVTRRHGH
jgi:immune inhibitor A